MVHFPEVRYRIQESKITAFKIIRRSTEAWTCFLVCMLQSVGDCVSWREKEFQSTFWSRSISSLEKKSSFCIFSKASDRKIFKEHYSAQIRWLLVYSSLQSSSRRLFDVFVSAAEHDFDHADKVVRPEAEKMYST